MFQQTNGSEDDEISAAKSKLQSNPLFNLLKSRSSSSSGSSSSNNSSTITVRDYDHEYNLKLYKSLFREIVWVLGCMFVMKNHFTMVYWTIMNGITARIIQSPLFFIYIFRFQTIGLLSRPFKSSFEKMTENLRKTLEIKSQLEEEEKEKEEEKREVITSTVEVTPSNTSAVSTSSNVEVVESPSASPLPEKEEVDSSTLKKNRKNKKKMKKDKKSKRKHGNDSIRTEELQADAVPETSKTENLSAVPIKEDIDLHPPAKTAFLAHNHENFDSMERKSSSASCLDNQNHWNVIEDDQFLTDNDDNDDVEKREGLTGEITTTFRRDQASNDLEIREEEVEEEGLEGISEANLYEEGETIPSELELTSKDSLDNEPEEDLLAELEELEELDEFPEDFPVESNTTEPTEERDMYSHWEESSSAVLNHDKSQGNSLEGEEVEEEENNDPYDNERSNQDKSEAREALERVEEEEEEEEGKDWSSEELDQIRQENEADDDLWEGNSEIVGKEELEREEVEGTEIEEEEEEGEELSELEKLQKEMDEIESMLNRLNQDFSSKK